MKLNPFKKSEVNPFQKIYADVRKRVDSIDGSKDMSDEARVAEYEKVKESFRSLYGAGTDLQREVDSLKIDFDTEVGGQMSTAAFTGLLAATPAVAAGAFLLPLVLVAAPLGVMAHRRIANWSRGNRLDLTAKDVKYITKTKKLEIKVDSAIQALQKKIERNNARTIAQEAEDQQRANIREGRTALAAQFNDKTPAEQQAEAPSPGLTEDVMPVSIVPEAVAAFSAKKPDAPEKAAIKWGRSGKMDI